MCVFASFFSCQRFSKSAADLHVSKSAAPRPPLRRLEGSHVDREAILHILLEQPLVGFVDLLYGNHLNVRSDVLLAAEIKHLLGFWQAADRRTGQTAPSEDESE